LSKRDDQDTDKAQAPEVIPSPFFINHTGSKFGRDLIREQANETGYQLSGPAETGMLREGTA